MIAKANALQDCWNRIGVSGDRSCPELVVHTHCRNCPVFAASAQTLFDRPAPAGYLDEWTAALTATEQKPATDSISLFIFRAGSELLALGTSSLIEVTKQRPIHRIPHRTNAILRGLVNIRGQLQLCVSLHGLFGLPVCEEAQALLVVAGDQSEQWVFLADQVLGVERVPKSSMHKVPGTLANAAASFTQAVFDREQRHVGYLDEHRVFAAFRSLGQ